ncbi:MAG: GIY-YIG nuclease family protein [Chloroflexi bacterium]|nr:GIY-YIG nuclease family protein [Chloroflexota bacterium]
MNEYYVYIMASKRNGTLYIGVTNDIVERVYQHKNDEIESFTAKYEVHHLVWYESCKDVREAIAREKQLKDWHRQWKIDLIETSNPAWEDLYYKLLGDVDSGSSPE